MKNTIIFMVLLSSFNVRAQCIGSDTFSTCTDNNGNSYTVNRMGNMTTVNGNFSNGSTWSQSSTAIGNFTYTNGTAANGKSWNETQINTGERRIVTGINSQGEPYSYSCNQYGCN